jgi:hypothetical protein
MLQQLLMEAEYLTLEGAHDPTTDEKSFARSKMLDSCQLFLETFGRNREEASSSIYSRNEGNDQKVTGFGEEKTAEGDFIPVSPELTPSKKKPRRSILFGAVMGVVVACWVFSGNYIFTGLFTLMTILGQVWGISLLFYYLRSMLY